MRNGNGAALLVIDVQVAIMDGDGSYPSIHQRDEVLARIGGLLARAREAGSPVIYVQHEEPDYPPMRSGADGWQIQPAIAPCDGETIVQKRASDAFYGTPLRAELDRLGVTLLVVAGCETDHCVDSTVRRALTLDYDVTLAADAHTTTTGALGDGPSPDAVITHHNTILANLPYPQHGVTVTPAAQITF